MAQKKPFTKNQKIVLGGLVVLAVAAIGVKAAMGPATPSHTVPPPPVKTAPMHPSSAPVIRHPVAPSGFTPNLAHPFVPHTAASMNSSAKSASKPDPLAAVDLLQNAAQGTAWAIYAEPALAHAGWYSVLYRTSLGGENHYAIAWVNVPQKVLVLGSVLNPTGTPWHYPEHFLLHAERHGVHLPNLLASGQAKFHNHLINSYTANGVLTGTKGPLITVFFDPNSGKAAHFFDQTQGFVASGNLRIRWVPIAVLNKTSLYRAETILSAPEPSTMVKQDLAHYSFHEQKGGVPSAYDAPESMMEQIDNNTNILAQTGHLGPIGIVYCHAGHLHIRYSTISGSNLPAWVSSLSTSCPGETQ